jgi:hypothetical protein
MAARPHRDGVQRTFSGSSRTKNIGGECPTSKARPLCLIALGPVATGCRHHHRSAVDVSGAHHRSGPAPGSRCTVRRRSQPQRQNDDDDSAGTDRQDDVRSGSSGTDPAPRPRPRKARAMNGRASRRLGRSGASARLPQCPRRRAAAASMRRCVRESPITTGRRFSSKPRYRRTLRRAEQLLERQLEHVGADVRGEVNHLRHDRVGPPEYLFASGATNSRLGG